MNEQAAALQEYLRRSHLKHVLDVQQQSDRGHSKIIAVSSGKGGVGTSMLALNLGVSAQEKTLIVDGDLLLGNLGVLTGCAPTTSWEDILTQRHSWTKHLHTLNSSTDLFVGTPFDSEESLRRIYTSKRLAQLIHFWGKEYDLIVIDTASGLTTAVIEWCLIASQIIVMSTPDPAAITDGYALIKSLALTNAPIDVGIVINQYIDTDDPDHIGEHLKILAAEYLETSVSLWGAIPWMPEIALSSREQTPIMLTENAEFAAPFLRQIYTRIQHNSNRRSYEMKHAG